MATLTIGDGGLDEKTAAIEAFVGANRDPAQSANLGSADADPIEAVANLLGQICVQRRYMDCQKPLLLLLSAIKILCRKEVNRAAVPAPALECLLDLIEDDDAGEEVQRQAANALLNACHSEICGQRLLSMKRAVALGRLLGSGSDPVVHAAAGALRNLSYHRGGSRIALPWIGAIVALLHPGRPERTRSRAIGILHSITKDADAAVLVQRHRDALPLIIAMLGAGCDLDTRAAAAGALQNLASDDSARRAINDLGAIDLLSDLIVTAHPAAQANAIGALWNMVQHDRAGADLRLFKSALSSSIAAAIMLDSESG